MWFDINVVDGWLLGFGPLCWCNYQFQTGLVCLMKIFHQYKTCCNDYCSHVVILKHYVLDDWDDLLNPCTITSHRIQTRGPWGTFRGWRPVITRCGYIMMVLCRTFIVMKANIISSLLGQRRKLFMLVVLIAVMAVTMASITTAGVTAMVAPMTQVMPSIINMIRVLGTRTFS